MYTTFPDRKDTAMENVSCTTEKKKGKNYLHLFFIVVGRNKKPYINKHLSANFGEEINTTFLTTIFKYGVTTGERNGFVCKSTYCIFERVFRGNIVQFINSEGGEVETTAMTLLNIPLVIILLVGCKIQSKKRKPLN